MKEPKPINILSLFDGISCGQIALQRTGIEINKYYASEIDKFAISVTQKHFPNTIQLGDMTKWRDWDLDWSEIDILFAGFPCQAWSLSGKQKGVEDPRGSLAIELCELFNFIKSKNPNILFLFENVKMKPEHLKYLNNLFGVDAQVINSSLVSAQNRLRNYWTNIPILPILDKGLVMKDILEVNVIGYDISDKRKAIIKSGNFRQTCRIFDINGKCCTLMAGMGMGGGTVPKINTPLRYITPLEAERLQTLPDNYTNILSKTQRYKCIGNGWTVDIISCILSGIHYINK